VTCVVCVCVCVCVLGSGGGSYKTEAGNQLCTQCGAGYTTNGTLGATSAGQCVASSSGGGDVGGDDGGLSTNEIIAVVGNPSACASPPLTHPHHPLAQTHVYHSTVTVSLADWHIGTGNRRSDRCPFRWSSVREVTSCTRSQE
jgi:hypothetical protein